MVKDSDGLAGRGSAWRPLGYPVFRSLWIANLVSMVGTWMHEVAAGWLMTSLAPSPVMVSLVQAATTFPVFLLALPAGALADVMDRRRILLVSQVWASFAAILLALLTLAGAVTPATLLALTFALGLGTALNAPAWQAILPELVPRPDVYAAVSLNGLAINLSRAVGPALGGAIIAAAGSGWAFALNAVSFLGVMVALYRWKRPPRESALPAERILGAARAGLRYVRHAPVLKAVLLRGAAFILPASALWALLPLVARAELGRGAAGYGVLMGCIGLGAVAGAAVMPRMRSRASAEGIVASATLLFAASTLALAHLRHFPAVCAAMFAGGWAWLALLSTFNSSAQLSVPSWVRARALGVYLLVLFGSLAVGSPLWGKIAALAGIPACLDLAALGLAAGLAATARLRLGGGEGADLTPSLHWSPPPAVPETLLHRGPVVVTVEYSIDPARLSEFRLAMGEMRHIRLRDGALRWELYSDPAAPDRFLEAYVVESWIEHLRLHERFTVVDREIEARARGFHRGEEPPKVSHLIAEPLPKG